MPWRFYHNKEATGGCGVTEQHDWLTTLNSYLISWKRGKGWRGRPARKQCNHFPSDDGGLDKVVVAEWVKVVRFNMFQWDLTTDRL